MPANEYTLFNLHFHAADYFIIFKVLLITRYSRPEMRGIWTDENKLKIWLQIELLASEALVKEGVVPAKDFAKIKAGCDKWYSADLPGIAMARQRELEKTLNHDVIGFTTAVAEKIDDKASRWFHFWADEQRRGRHVFHAVQMSQSADHFGSPDTKLLLTAIAKRARTGAQVHAPCIGRSHAASMPSRRRSD